MHILNLFAFGLLLQVVQQAAQEVGLEEKINAFAGRR
jgi:hypothetical protein